MSPFQTFELLESFLVTADRVAAAA